MLREILLFILISCVSCEKRGKLKDIKEDNVLLGLNTVRDVKIDKDAIINKGAGNDQETEPDWYYSSYPKEVRFHVEQFKRNMTECLKEVQRNENNGVQRLSPKKNSPVHGECLIACVFKRNGVIRKGKIYKENVLALVNKFYAKEVKMMKKLEKQVDRCIDLSVRGGGDDCALASRLNDCTNTLLEYNKHTIAVKYGQ